ncbi:MAG: hypothetical protein AMQ22_00046 [Candidatus Methanofastidiosum methylothiophilum]|uniref:Uncharacterized protein n=1 Tax=Candidatus Methanofastidiosum methylothiophilum TaxID=1705564 RepID=A0A150J9D6_9EURY|nr:MAG: hypothetical protein AMQ22_00046 [Candidatus Methanofastidiosum methylthiophilus]
MAWIVTISDYQIGIAVGVTVTILGLVGLMMLIWMRTKTEKLNNKLEKV